MKFTTIAQAKKETGLSYLGGIATSAKIDHSRKYSHQYTYGLYLAPANVSGYNVCSHSTSECRLGCLNTSGRAGIETNCTKLWAKSQCFLLRFEEEVFESPGGFFVKVRVRIFLEEYLIVFERGPIGRF